MSTDLDAFYSSETVDVWKQIIGESLHYHFGYFQGNEELEVGLRQTVKNFYPHIPLGAQVLDVGCGWGGPAIMLAKERHCAVQGITISEAQVTYCQDISLDVWHCNIEQEQISGTYDVVFMLEVLSHIHNKARVLAKLRTLAPRLVISMHCVADNSDTPRTVFGGSMELISKSEFVQALEAAGWHIKSMRNRRFQSMRTLILWKQNLERAYGKQPLPGHLDALYKLTETALRSPHLWCRSFPLIDIVAEA